MTQEIKKYQNPTEFIKLVNSDMSDLKTSRFFYKEVATDVFTLFFNPNIETDPDGNKAVQLTELVSKFVAYRLVTTLNRTLLHCNHDFEQTLVRQSNFIKK